MGWVSSIHQRNAFLEDFGVAPSSERLQSGRDLAQSIVTGTEILADLTGVNTASILASGQTVTGQDPTALDALAVVPAFRVGKHAKIDNKVVPNAGGIIRSFTTQTDEVFYRVYSGDNIKGSFLTKVPPSSSLFAREVLALPINNQAEFIQEVLVPAGTRLQRSRALPAFGRRGGAEQFQLLDQIPDSAFKPGRKLKP